MKIQLNGDPYEIPEPIALSELLARLEIDPRRVAVEHNLTVIRRANFDQTIVKEGDEVEVVSFIGGGALTDSPQRSRRPQRKTLIVSVCSVGSVVHRGCESDRTRIPTTIDS